MSGTETRDGNALCECGKALGQHFGPKFRCDKGGHGSMPTFRPAASVVPAGEAPTRCEFCRSAKHTLPDCLMLGSEAYRRERGRPAADDPEPVEPSDDIDGFMASISEWVVLTAYRLAHEPLSQTVPPEELEAYSRAKRHLRRALSSSGASPEREP